MGTKLDLSYMYMMMLFYIVNLPWRDDIIYFGFQFDRDGFSGGVGGLESPTAGNPMKPAKRLNPSTNLRKKKVKKASPKFIPRSVHVI